MTSQRRLGADDSKVRAALLDAAEHVLVEDGYAAVTTRSVAARAGRKAQLVHYYFRTMDDLILAMLRRNMERNLERQRRALSSRQPLRELWALSTEPTAAALTMELMALSNHRKEIRKEIAAHGELVRSLQAEVLASVLYEHDIDVPLPPAALVLLMTAVSRILVNEETIGMSTGHAELRALVDDYLVLFEPTPTVRPSRGSATP